MTLRRLIALVLFVFLSGCAPSAPAPTGTGLPSVAASPAVAEPAGPILQLVVAADIDNEGNPVDPSFTVPADQAQITVIARIGQLDESSRMELVWYRLPDAWAADEDAEQELFRHELEVTSRDLAWSVGTNPGTLVSASYLVRATLGAQTEEVEFEVASASSATAPSPPGEPTGEPASASLPASGGSGTSQAASGGAGCEPLLLETLQAALAEAAAAVDLDAHRVESPMWELPECGISITSIGIAIGIGPLLYASFPVDPCNLPDGRDLPGTTVNVTGTLRGEAFPTQTIILGDDTLAPRARVRSDPGAGQRVEEGDQIHVTALAQERRSGGPWQMGLAQIQLLSLRPSQELVDSVDFTSQRGKACDGKAWDGTLEATYTVPPNPPPVIELCVVAEDWAGNGQERGEWKCAEFPTGEVWEGTEHGEWRNPAAAGIPGAVIEGDLVSKHDGIIKLTVASDGSVSGEGSGTQVAPAGSATYTTKFGGTRKDDAFRPLKMTFSPGGSADFVVPISGRTAELVSKQVVSGQTYTLTIKLKCVSCEEAVG